MGTNLYDKFPFTSGSQAVLSARLRLFWPASIFRPKSFWLAHGFLTGLLGHRLPAVRSISRRISWRTKCLFRDKHAFVRLAMYYGGLESFFTLQ